MPITSDERIRRRDRVTSVAPMQEQHKIRKKVCRSKHIRRKLSSTDRTRPVDLVATNRASIPRMALTGFNRLATCGMMMARTPMRAKRRCNGYIRQQDGRYRRED